MMKRIVTLAALAAVLWAQGAAAQTSAADGRSLSGQPVQGTMIGGYDGSSFRVMRTDASGIHKIAEEYPRNWQTGYLPFLTDSTACTTGLKPFGIGVTAFPYVSMGLEYAVGVSATHANTIWLYLFSSEDNTTWSPALISRGIAGSTTPQYYADTVKTAVVVSAGGQAKGTWAIPSGYWGKYLQVWAFRDSSNTSTAKILALRLRGREQ